MLEDTRDVFWHQVQIFLYSPCYSSFSSFWVTCPIWEFQQYHDQREYVFTNIPASQLLDMLKLSLSRCPDGRLQSRRTCAHILLPTSALGKLGAYKRI